MALKILVSYFNYLDGDGQVFECRKFNTFKVNAMPIERQIVSYQICFTKNSFFESQNHKDSDALRWYPLCQLKNIHMPYILTRNLY